MNDTATGSGDQAVALGPVAVSGLVLLALGFLRRRPLLVFVGAVLVGLGVKLVDRGNAESAG